MRFSGHSVVETWSNLAPVAERLPASSCAPLLQSDVAPSNYLILETSPDLKVRQAELLAQQFPECRPYFRWIDDFPPTGFRGVLLANELLDAFPVSRFQILNDTVTELGVGWDYDQFNWSRRRPGWELEEAIEQLLAALPETLPPSYASEMSLIRGVWIPGDVGKTRHGSGASIRLWLSAIRVLPPATRQRHALLLLPDIACTTTR